MVRTEPQVIAMRKPQASEAGNNIIRVLSLMPLEEDHENLKQILAGPRWALHEVVTLAAATAYLRGNDLSLVLCDADASPDAWKELLRLIAGTRDAPLLIVSSRLADERLWAEALNLGAYDVLAKPFEAAEVIRVLTHAWLRWTREREPTAAAERTMAAG